MLLTSNQWRIRNLTTKNMTHKSMTILMGRQKRNPGSENFQQTRR